jgi:hypothetical protein
MNYADKENRGSSKKERLKERKKKVKKKKVGKKLN